MKFFALFMAILLTATTVVCLYQSIATYSTYRATTSKKKTKQRTLILKRYRITALCTLVSYLLATLFIIYSVS